MKINNNINQVLFFGVCFILFLPIIVLPPDFQPSDWTRSILFRIIITALVSFLFFKFFYKKSISIELPAWNKSLYLPMLILSVFFITLIIATIFSQDISFSIFGSPLRAGGVLNLLFFFIFSIILALFIDKNHWEKLFNILFITGGITSLLAIIQYFNLLKNIFISYEEGSTPSFLGNSTVLAIYMLFLTFLAFVFFIQKQKRREKLLYGALFLLFIFTIFITGSRAAYLGLLAGFLYFFFFYPATNEIQAQSTEKSGKWHYLKLKTLKIIAASFLILAIITVLFFNFFPQFGEKNSFFKILTSRLSIEKIAMDILGTRLPVWKMTLEAIKDRPLLGWGPENFYIGFEKYYDPTPFSHPVLLWDRPHNIILDIAVSSGIFSLLIYLFFWISLFWQLQKIKHIEKNADYYDENILKTHGVQSMFIGYLIVLFFNFDSFASYLISFFFIGYSFYLISNREKRLIILPLRNVFFRKKLLVFICFTMVIIFLWFWNIKPLYLG
ncbi:MAG: O-antigen ligase family protein, partial [Candidatus Staskawiczbacteria bacterium]|nr:O-antigen ligase family protein [Candidatus Staskawiczbacteria bacterium]